MAFHAKKIPCIILSVREYVTLGHRTSLSPLYCLMKGDSEQTLALRLGGGKGSSTPCRMNRLIPWSPLQLGSLTPQVTTQSIVGSPHTRKSTSSHPRSEGHPPRDECPLSSHFKRVSSFRRKHRQTSPPKINLLTLQEVYTPRSLSLSPLICKTGVTVLTRLSTLCVNTGQMSGYGTQQLVGV